MASLMTALVSHLTESELVSAVVADRVSAEVAGKDEALPYLVVRMAGGSRANGMEGAGAIDHRQARVLIECHETSPALAMDLANLVIDVLDGHLGPTLGHGAEALPCASVMLDDTDFSVTELPGGAEASSYITAPAFAAWYVQE